MKFTHSAVCLRNVALETAASAAARRACLALLLLAGFGSPEAQPTLRLQIASVTWLGRDGAGYDLFDATPYCQPVEFTVQHSGAAGPYFVTFSKTAPDNTPRLLRGAGETLAYQLYDTTTLNNVLKDLPAASATEVLSGAFGAGNAAHTHRFVVALPAQQTAAPGAYQASIQVNLYAGTLASFTLAQSTVIQLSVPVLAVTALSLVPTGGEFDSTTTSQPLDFGPLAKGKALGLDLLVRSTSGYTLSLQSDNGGVLKSLDPTIPDRVPYTLSVAGAPVALRTEPVQAVVRPGAATGPQGERYVLLVTIGDLGNATAGNYRDVVTITIQAGN